jgi:hypothetical protein
MLAVDFKEGKKLLAQAPRFQENAAFLQNVLEAGRRHKVRNPDKLRDVYGKLIYLLMDAQNPDIARRLGFSLKSEMKTCLGLLAARNARAFLADPLLPTATGQVVESRCRDREHLAAELALKTAAGVRLSTKYTQPAGPLLPGEVELIVASLSDYHSYLESNRGPVDAMLGYLNDRFDPQDPGDYPLAIRAGTQGACLTHPHESQFHFARQSLTLWREIMHNMFKLWSLAESDLTDPDNYYRLRNTGQGLQRMQSSTRLAHAMAEIVGKVQREIGGWIGLSVVHLGDRDVPNGLVFIDKYNQVSRILAPIVTCLKRLESAVADSDLTRFMDSAFGGAREAQMSILSDFFKHGFDGSGDDGGSCVDGRLTSCWNWCSLLPKKDYYALFLMTGFLGFDGSFD